MENQGDSTTFQTLEMKTIFTCWSDSLQRFIDIHGRTTRYEFWAFQTVSLFIFLFLTLIGWLFDAYKVVYEIYGLYLIVPFTSVSIRRLHDIGFSAKAVLPSTLLGILVLLNLEFDIVNTFLTIFLWLVYTSYLCAIFALKGEDGDNMYGTKVREAAVYDQDSRYFMNFMLVSLIFAWIIFFVRLF